ncbi:MAG: threonylcarbamoyl-AMP synthase [Clostridia bacterium]|nr:threonylcarbamoyl-AMP synthase [Clostridia bacterium]
MTADRKTEIFKIDPENIDCEVLKYCAERLKEGALVCFPTETVYGLGANAFMRDSVKKIFKAKGRPADNPLIVHISDYSMLDGVAECNEKQREMLERIGAKYWPGPLTMIVSKHNDIPSEVSCGLSTVGIRLPVNPIARKLIEFAGVPVAAPSANLSGKPSPSLASHVIEDLNGRVDIIIDGGACGIGVESTVLDISGEKPVILRPGAVTLEDITVLYYDADEFDWKSSHAGGDDCDIGNPKSPGMKYTHYSPEAEVIIYDGKRENIVREIKNVARECMKDGIPVGILAADENADTYGEFEHVLKLGSADDGLAQASNLFKLLREFDKLGVKKVFAEAVSCGGVGDAVMNRLFRSAGGNVINADK